MYFNKLKPEEEKIIVHKGTEAPFSGEYDDFFKDGVYVCRRCNTPLYRSDDKFDSHCGWPSFDQEISGSVKRLADADGIRTEIICAACGAHLGHVFENEKLTPKNVRHCVNSLSMQFVAKSEAEFRETAVFGGGCFWCLEAIFIRLNGVLLVEPGYAGGDKNNPSYEEVSGGKTGHAETIRIQFDPSLISYHVLLDVFFALHDPTTMNRQNNDIGPQYRSIILYASELQKTIAENFIKELTEKKVFQDPIVTEVSALKDFYPAEEYHRNYYELNSSQPYCRAIISPKIKKLTEKYQKLLKQ